VENPWTLFAPRSVCLHDWIRRSFMHKSQVVVGPFRIWDMKQIAFYETFAYNPVTCDYDRWMGTAPVEAIAKYGLAADLSYPIYGDAKLCVDGWGLKPL
jgi:hypothetical protein